MYIHCFEIIVILKKEMIKFLYGELETFIRIRGEKIKIRVS